MQAQGRGAVWAEQGEQREPWLTRTAWGLGGASVFPVYTGTEFHRRGTG